MPRKPMTKETKIKRALERGLSAQEIARRYNTSPQYVNVIRRKMTRDQARETQYEHIVGPLPETPVKEEPMFATGIVALHPVPETQQPAVGIMAIPPGAGEVKELEGPPPPPPLTLWQRFKLWAWGRA